MGEVEMGGGVQKGGTLRTGSDGGLPSLVSALPEHPDAARGDLGGAMSSDPEGQQSLWGQAGQLLGYRMSRYGLVMDMPSRLSTSHSACTRIPPYLGAAKAARTLAFDGIFYSHPSISKGLFPC